MLCVILITIVTFMFITLMVMSEITLEVELCVAKKVPYPHSSELLTELYRELRPRILRRGPVTVEMVESRYKALRITLGRVIVSKLL